MASQVEGTGAKGSIAVVCVHVFGIRFLPQCQLKSADVLEVTDQRHLLSFFDNFLEKYDICLVAC